MERETREELLQYNRELLARLEEAEETLRALRSGEVDAVVASGPDGEQVYTLRGADEAYRALVQGMAEGALTLTSDGLILFANEQFATLVHRPLERVIGAVVHEFVAEEDAGVLAALLRGSRGRKAEVRLKASGAVVPVYLSAENLVLDGTECLCLVVTDLSGQKRNEEIVAAEKLARSILEQAAEAILVVDPDGRIIRASRSAESLAGMPVLQRGFDEIFPIRLHSSAPFPFRAIVAATSQNQTLRDIEATAVMPDGRCVELLMSAAMLSGSGSEVLGCVMNLRDITARKRSENALKESEERFRLAVKATNAAVWDLDLATGFVSRNETYITHYGKAAEDNGTLEWWLDRIHPEDRERTSSSLDAAINGQEATWTTEYRFLRADGGWAYIYDRAYIARDGAGRAWRVIGAMQDLTERKEAEERLQQSQKLESIGLLAGGIAHDFNNLLVGVIGNASMAQELVPPGSRFSELLDGIAKTGEQLANLTRQMLAYAGKGRFFLERLDLSALVPEMNSLVQHSIPKRIDVQFELAENLPAIEADRGQIHQVFMNLVLNAAESIESVGGSIGIETGALNLDETYSRLHPETAGLSPGSYVYLKVRDTGCGMDPATRMKVFDPFFTTKFTGRGLGLAAVSGIVRSHKGAISVASEKGRGSCFMVLFPAATGAPAVNGAPESKELLGNGGSVLVVDDEAVVREIAKKALTHYGFEVLLARNGLEAIQVLRENPGRVGLVVLDLSMPVMSGDEALPELRKVSPGIKVVVTSGYNETETIALFKGQPVAGFIQKPYTTRKLAERIRSALG